MAIALAAVAIIGKELALQLLLGDTLSALHHLHTAVRLDPDMTDGWLSLGRLYLARGDNQEAREALGAFIRLAGTRFPDQVQWAREAMDSLP